MIFGSVCSGIEAASAAWHPLGWRAAFYSEIDRFSNALLAQRYDAPNHGDMLKFKGWPDATLDVLLGGTPCQSFSIAGLRAGLADPRGSLALAYLAIARRYRARWMAWENVPGVLSSDGGRDFASFLAAVGECGYGWAYRVLDAQYFGVPQRRRRVFLVASLAGWQSAAAVLFERESLQRHFAPSSEARENTSRAAADGARADSGGDADRLMVPAVANSLTRRMEKGINTTADEGQTLIPCVAFAQNSRDEVLEKPIADALKFGGGKPGQSYPVIRHGLAVRRLTPIECERLQGFPDDYTRIEYRRRPAKDAPRYKALGNSIAVPVLRWIGERIELVESVMQEIAA